jgi:hypothetical protein
MGLAGLALLVASIGCEFRDVGALFVRFHLVGFGLICIFVGRDTAKSVLPWMIVGTILLAAGLFPWKWLFSRTNR